MASEKYGRLFTEKDMLDAIQGAYELGILGAKGGARVGDGQRHPGMLDVLAQHPFEPTFPPNEPLFLLRGQDVFAEVTIRDYAKEAQGIIMWPTGDGRTATTSRAFRDAVEDVADRFYRWRFNHPRRMRVPD